MSEISVDGNISFGHRDLDVFLACQDFYFAVVNGDYAFRVQFVQKDFTDCGFAVVELAREADVAYIAHY